MSIGLSDIIDKVSKVTGYPKIVVGRVLSSMILVIKHSLATHGSVSIKGFGVFRLVMAKARKARNPKTGDVMDLPPTKRVRFSPSRTLTTEKQQDD